MLFKQAQDVVDGRKRQTRRPVKPGDRPSHDENGNVVAVYRHGRLLWKVGKDYAAQPGRGKKAIGRTPPIKSIGWERLGDISRGDVSAEGLRREPASLYSLWEVRQAFRHVWNSLYRKPYRWEDNPVVWVLEFEPI